MYIDCILFILMITGNYWIMFRTMRSLSNIINNLCLLNDYYQMYEICCFYGDVSCQGVMGYCLKLTVSYLSH